RPPDRAGRTLRRGTGTDSGRRLLPLPGEPLAAQESSTGARGVRSIPGEDETADEPGADGSSGQPCSRLENAARGVPVPAGAPPGIRTGGGDARSISADASPGLLLPL